MSKFAGDAGNFFWEMPLKLAIVIVFLLSPVRSCASDLVNEYNNFFFNKNYEAAFKTVSCLVSSYPQEVIFRRELIKMLAVTNQSAEFVRELKLLRDSGSKGSLEAILHIVSHPLVSNNLRDTAHGYFKMMSDTAILNVWPKNDLQLLQESGRVTIESKKVESKTTSPRKSQVVSHLKVASEFNSSDKRHVSPPKIQEATRVPDTSVSAVATKPVSEVEESRARLDAQQAIEFGRRVAKESSKDTYNTLTPSTILLDYCKKHKKFGYLVFDEFMSLLRIGKSEALRTCGGLNHQAFFYPLEYFLKSVEQSSFDNAQLDELIEFVIKCHVENDYSFSQGFFRISNEENKLLLSRPDVAKNCLDSILNGMSLPVEKKTAEKVKNRANLLRSRIR